MWLKDLVYKKTFRLSSHTLGTVKCHVQDKIDKNSHYCGKLSLFRIRTFGQQATHN